jgi:hypothetical protein
MTILLKPSPSMLKRSKSFDLASAFHLPGQHDQKEHGNRRRTEFVRVWRKISTKAGIRRLQKLHNRYYRPGTEVHQRLDDSIARRNEHTEFYELPGNPDLVMVDGADTLPYDQKKLDDMMSRLAFLIHSYPPPQTLEVRVTPIGFDVGDVHEGFGGFAELGGTKISLNQVHFQTGVYTSRQGTHSMPATPSTTYQQYLITHEFGHTATPKDTTGPEAMFTQYKADLSSYGQNNWAEGFAEAFAEWDTTCGHTLNGAAGAYAKRFGWKDDYLC